MEGKIISKDIYNPYTGELPMPLDYDVYLILCLIKHVKDEKVKQKINDVMLYILDPRYQKLCGDYGWY